MKYETVKNYLSSRLRLVSKLQLILFKTLRHVGLSEPLGLVQGVCCLKAKNPSAVACEGIRVLAPRRDPDRFGFAKEKPLSSGNSHSSFIEVSDGHCLVTSGYFEVAILDKKRRLI